MTEAEPTDTGLRAEKIAEELGRLGTRARGLWLAEEGSTDGEALGRGIEDLADAVLTLAAGPWVVEREKCTCPSLPPSLRSVEDVRQVCESAGLTEQPLAAGHNSRTWTSAHGDVRVRASFLQDVVYCVSLIDPFAVDMFQGITPRALASLIRSAREETP